MVGFLGGFLTYRPDAFGGFLEVFAFSLEFFKVLLEVLEYVLQVVECRFFRDCCITWELMVS